MTLFVVSGQWSAGVARGAWLGVRGRSGATVSVRGGVENDDRGKLDSAGGSWTGAGRCEGNGNAGLAPSSGRWSIQESCRSETVGCAAPSNGALATGN